MGQNRKPEDLRKISDLIDQKMRLSQLIADAQKTETRQKYERELRDVLSELRSLGY